MIAWFIALFDEGYCLDGDFKGDDFRIDFCGNLKGKLSLLPLVKKVSPVAEVEAAASGAAVAGAPVAAAAGAPAAAGALVAVET